MKRPSPRLALTAGLAATALAAVGASLLPGSGGAAALAADAPLRASTVAVQQPAPEDTPGRPDRDCPRDAEPGGPAAPAQPAPAQPVAGTAL